MRVQLCIKRSTHARFEDEIIGAAGVSAKTSLTCCSVAAQSTPNVESKSLGMGVYERWRSQEAILALANNTTHDASNHLFSKRSTIGDEP